MELSKFRNEIPRIVTAMHGIAFAAEKVAAKSDDIFRRAQRDAEKAKFYLKDARGLTKQAVEGDYLKATDDQTKAAIVGANARRTMRKFGERRQYHPAK